MCRDSRAVDGGGVSRERATRPGQDHCPVLPGAQCGGGGLRHAHGDREDRHDSGPGGEGRPREGVSVPHQVSSQMWVGC